MKKPFRIPKPIRYIFVLIDSVIFSAIIVFAVKLNSSVDSTLFWVVVLAAVSGMTLALKSNQKKKKHIRQLSSNRRTELLMRVLLMSDKELSAALQTDRFILIRKSRPDLYDAMEAVRKGADAIGVTDGGREIADLLQSCYPGIRMVFFDEITDAVFPEAATKYRGDTKTTGFLEKIKLNKYLILGILLFTVSFFIRYKIYFRMISVICMLFATISGIFRGLHSYTNFMIFLDKKED